jgi:hypothetical protein
VRHPDRGYEKAREAAQATLESRQDGSLAGS